MRDVYEKAKELYKLGHYEEALPLLQKTVQIHNDYADVHNMLGVALSMKSRYNEAINHFLKALEINENYNEVRINLAITYSNIGFTGEAQFELEELIQFDQEDQRLKKEAEYKLADLHAETGEVMMDLGLFGEAVVHFKKALGYCNRFVDIFNKYGLCLMAMHLPGDAVNMFRKALEVNPDYDPARINLGLALYKNHQVEEAVAEWNRISKKDISCGKVRKYLEVAREKNKHLLPTEVD